MESKDKIKKTESVTPSRTTIKVEKTETPTTAKTETVSIDKTPGRPVNMDSKRQKVMLEREVKRQRGELKKGRPVSTDSKRHQQELEKAAKREAGLLKPGRPKYSDEQKKEADAKKAQRKTDEAIRIKEIASKMLAEKGVIPVVESAKELDVVLTS